MKKMFKNRSSFYIKTLAAYGILLALLYCTSMRRDDGHDDVSQLDVVGECAVGTGGAVGDVNDSSFHYSLMMNLISQVRPIEAKFRKYILEFERRYNDGLSDDDARLFKVQQLNSKIKKISGRLRHERGRFMEHIANSRFGPEKSRGVARKFLCSKGPCPPSSNAALSLRARRKKSDLYICQVLKEYIERLDIMSGDIEGLIQKYRMIDKAAKVRSEMAARKASQDVSESNSSDSSI